MIDAINGFAGGANEPISEHRTLHDLEVSQAQLLEEILAELRKGNSRSDSASSIAIEDLAKGDPKVTSKFYVGSPLTKDDVDQVLAVHAYAHRRAAELAMHSWAETLAAGRNGASS